MRLRIHGAIPPFPIRLHCKAPGLYLTTGARLKRFGSHISPIRTHNQYCWHRVICDSAAFRVQSNISIPVHNIAPHHEDVRGDLALDGGERSAVLPGTHTFISMSIRNSRARAERCIPHQQTHCTETHYFSSHFAKYAPQSGIT